MKPIGSGGFSQVYEAWQPDFNRWAAVKVLTLESGLDLDRAGFERECRAMGSVSEHPNIVTVYDSGFTTEGAPYIAMERYQQTLLDRIKINGYLGVTEVLDAGVQMCAALQRAHDAGILHRDIKPQNIFYNNYGDPVLADFGIASLASDSASQETMGMSLHYVAPEILEGATPVIESDLYSLGATLYTALAGHRPFAGPKGEPRARLSRRVLTEPPPPITVQSVPPYVERAVVGLMAKHPNDRPRTATDTATILRDLQTRMGVPATALRIAEVDVDSDITIAKVQSLNGGLSLRSPAAADFDETSAATIIRPSTTGAPTNQFAEPPKDKRLIYGLLILGAVLAIGAMGVAIAATTGQTNSTAITTTSMSNPISTTIRDLTAPETPTGVQQLVGDGLIELSWDEMDDASRYLVEFTVGEIASKHTELAQIEMDLPSEVACFTIKAISGSGKPSRPTEPECINP